MSNTLSLPAKRVYNELKYPNHGSANRPYEVEITDHRGNTSYHYCEETDLAACMWAIRELNPTTLQGATAITIRLDADGGQA